MVLPASSPGPSATRSDQPSTLLPMSCGGGHGPGRAHVMGPWIHSRAHFRHFSRSRLTAPCGLADPRSWRLRVWAPRRLPPPRPCCREPLSSQARQCVRSPRRADPAGVLPPWANSATSSSRPSPCTTSSNGSPSAGNDASTSTAPSSHWAAHSSAGDASREPPHDRVTSSQRARGRSGGLATCACRAGAPESSGLQRACADPHAGVRKLCAAAPFRGRGPVWPQLCGPLRARTASPQVPHCREERHSVVEPESGRGC